MTRSTWKTHPSVKKRLYMDETCGFYNPFGALVDLFFTRIENANREFVSVTTDKVVVQMIDHARIIWLSWIV